MESRRVTSNVSLQSRADLRIPVSVITDATNVVAIQATAGETIKERRTALPLPPYPSIVSTCIPPESDRLQGGAVSRSFMAKLLLPMHTD
jgi:hypothetical protein